MQVTNLSEQERHSRFMNEFDKFAFEAGESLTSVYKRFSRLVNDMDRNKIKLINMVLNTKFLNSLQPKWNKYVTNVHLTNKLRNNHYDVLFDHLHQYEALVNASRAKRAAKTHDPLTLVANTYPSSSSSRSPPDYYVIHPPSVIGYDDDYKGEAICDDQEDILTTLMMLLSRVITQHYSTPTNNRLRTFSNTRNQAIVQADRLDIQRKNVRNSGHYARDCLKPRVRDSKYFQEQLLIAKKDEAGIILNDEQNDFLIVDAYEVEEFDDLNVIVCMMAQIQQAGSDSKHGSIYDSDFISEVSGLCMSFINELYSKIDHEQTYHEQPEIIKPTIGDDQINSDIIFDYPNMKVNDEQVEQDKNAHDQRDTQFELLVKNVRKEAENNE
ncbi:hypothetical protein Tco_0907958 [Tanacetum coccineum]|uniref:Uncharacterized protein n=1 Tax=Tanacetum coccineum TaxID=301880 RepID=A0ABQ5CLJ8_9ASTR